MKVLRGKELSYFKSLIRNNLSTGSNLTLYQRRAVLRIGMLLRDSRVAKRVGSMQQRQATPLQEVRCVFINAPARLSAHINTTFPDSRHTAPPFAERRRGLSLTAPQMRKVVIGMGVFETLKPEKQKALLMLTEMKGILVAGTCVLSSGVVLRLGCQCVRFSNHVLTL